MVRRRAIPFPGTGKPRGRRLPLERPARALPGGVLLVPLVLLALLPMGWVAGLPGCNSPPYLYVDGGRIVDPAGREVLLRGVNLSQDNKYPHPGGSFVPDWIDEETFERIAAAGFNSVRFLLVWEAVEPAPGAYDDSYLDRVADLVRLAEAHGIQTVLDMHQDVYSRKFWGDGAPEWAVLDGGIPFEPNPTWFLNYLHPAVLTSFDNFWADTNGIQGRFREAWAAVAHRFRDEPGIAGYDLLNEPFPGSLWALPALFDTLSLIPFTSALADRIRAEDPYHIVLYEPSSIRTNMLAPFGFPSAFASAPDWNSALAPHLYDPLVTATHAWDGDRARIEREVQALDGEASRLGSALWIGEWNVWEYNVEGGVDYLDCQLDVMDAHAASWSFWEWNESDPRSPFNPGSPTAWIAEGLDRPYPQRTAGRIDRTTYDDSTGEFLLDFQPRPVATEVYLPSRIYGASPTIEAPAGASFAFDPASRILKVENVTGSTARLRVTPQ